MLSETLRQAQGRSLLTDAAGRLKAPDPETAVGRTSTRLGNATGGLALSRTRHTGGMWRPRLRRHEDERGACPRRPAIGDQEGCFAVSNGPGLRGQRDSASLLAATSLTIGSKRARRGDVAWLSHGTKGTGPDGHPACRSSRDGGSGCLAGDRRWRPTPGGHPSPSQRSVSLFTEKPGRLRLPWLPHPRVWPRGSFPGAGEAVTTVGLDGVAAFRQPRERGAD